MKAVSNDRRLRVLHILPGLKMCGGMESFVINYYREIHGEISFSFAIFGDIDDERAKEVKKLGGEIYHFGNLGFKNYFKAKKWFRELLTNSDFDIIHCHMANAAFIFFPIAKKLGIKIRILHSHQSKYADAMWHSIRNIPLIKLGLHYTSSYFACSKAAGDFLFGKRPYMIINNAVYPEKYKFRQSARNNIRAKYNIKQTDFLIGHVGRFEPQKNHSFIIDCFSKILKERANAKLILIGNGSLLEKIKDLVRANKLENTVRFVDSVNNIGEFLSAFDAFILPSKYEGLSVACVEAQCSGLNVVASDAITQETCIIPYLFKRLSLSDINIWVSAFTKMPLSNVDNRNNAYSMFLNTNYNIHSSAKALLSEYETIYNGNQHRYEGRNE